METGIIDMAGECPNAFERFFKCSNKERFYHFKIGCGKRFEVQCPTCSYKWMRKIKKRYSQAMANMKFPKLLTLTLIKNKKTGELLKDDIKDIWAMRNNLFHKLKYEGYKPTAWFGVVELPNHVHIVMDCKKFIPYDLLSQWWKEASNGSYVVDIRPINVQDNPAQAVHYITKYLTKNARNVTVDIEKLRSFRLIQSWGLVYQRVKFVCECGKENCLLVVDELEYLRTALRLQIENENKEIVAKAL